MYRQVADYICLQYSVTERRLNLYWDVMRRDEENILRKMLTMDIFQGKGREDVRKQDGNRRAKRYLKITGLRAGKETDWAMWRRKICSNGNPTWWEKPGEKKKMS